MVVVRIKQVCCNMKTASEPCLCRTGCQVDSADGRTSTLVASNKCNHWREFGVTTTTSLGWFFGANAEILLYFHGVCNDCGTRHTGSTRYWGWPNGDSGGATLHCTRCNNMLRIQHGETDDWRSILATAADIAMRSKDAHDQFRSGIPGDVIHN